VGRHYFSHNQGATDSLFPRNLNNWYGLPAQGTRRRLADDNFDHSGLDFIAAKLWVYSDRGPSVRRHEHVRQGPQWARWKAFIKENVDRWNTAYLQKTTLPMRTTISI